MVSSPIDDVEEHKDIKPPKDGKRRYCCVCKLEENWRKEAGLRDERKKNSRIQDHMAICRKCGLTAHNLCMDHDRLILQDEVFQGMSCFAIAHSKECAGLWSVSKKSGALKRKFKAKTSASGEEVPAKVVDANVPLYSVNTSHIVYQNLAFEYGVTPRVRKRKSDGISQDVDELDIEGEAEIEREVDDIANDVGSIFSADSEREDGIDKTDKDGSDDSSSSSSSSEDEGSDE